MEFDIINLHGGQQSYLSRIFNRTIRLYDGHIYHGKFPVFIVSNFHLKDHFDFFLYLEKNMISYGLVHVGDENYAGNLEAYFLDSCLFVIRQYYRPSGGIQHFIMLWLKSFSYKTIAKYKENILSRTVFKILYKIREVHPSSFLRQAFPVISNDKVFFIPLGYLDGFSDFEDDDNFSYVLDRQYNWSFCGDISKRDRKLMIKTLYRYSNGYVHENHGWMSISQIDAQSYKGVLLESKFVPCPMGYTNLETARIYEALESGAIPLLLRSHAFQPYDYFAALFGKHPLPVFDSWKEVGKFIAQISDESLVDLSEKVRSWWKKYKAELTERIEQVFCVVSCEQTPSQTVNIDWKL